MNNLYNSPAGSLIKTTLVDYPGIVACTIFLEGCNLRCPYCYNIDLVKGNFVNEAKRNYPTVTLNDVIQHIEKRKNVLSGIVISGGEPLINPRTPILIKEAKKRGLKIKLDTNGILPDKLQEIIEDPELRPDYIAMDIKTSPNRYNLLVEGIPQSNNSNLTENIIRSVKILSNLPEQTREWRTVLVPTLIDDKDIKQIANVLPQNAHWYFAQFRNDNCVNSSYQKISPYLDKEIDSLISLAKTLITGAEFR